MTSPYHQTAANLRENGYHVLPVAPGTKVPGQWTGSNWSGLPGWTKYCDGMPPEFVSDQWERWPDAGICVTHGNIIGLDLDTDRSDVAEALHAAVTPPDVRRRGSKGWLGYYRPGAGLDGLSARVRWYDKDGAICVELLLHGTQSVLPPTIHPDTGKPYRWLTPDTLEGTDISDLPEFAGSDLEALDREFARIGLTRQAPRQANIIPFIPAGESTPDLEKPYHRSVNDRALEANAIDTWFPLLNLPKTKQTGHGAWRAVPSWRPSGSGRAPGDRNANLGVHPTGIQDFARGESYTPISLVMAARQCHVSEATEWLEQYIRPEDIPDAGTMIANGAHVYEPPAPREQVIEATDYDKPTLDFLATESAGKMPDISGSIEGLLADLYEFTKEGMRREWPEAAMLVALNVLGITIGRNFATWSNFRSNLYTVVLAKSGWGKTSIYGPVVDLIIQAGMNDCLGAEKIQSDSALITEMVQAPENKKIFFLDEFGHMLQRCYDRGAGGHMRNIITEFTNLYSKAQGYYAGRSYADGRSNGAIHNPHLNIFGMATPRQFWDAFGSGAIEDGTLPRFSILKATTRPPRRDLKFDHLDTVEAMRDDLAPKLGKLFGMRKQRSGNIPSVEAVKVLPTKAAGKMWAEIEDRVENISTEAEVRMPDRDFGGILSRVAETAAKIALILAVSRNPEKPLILEPDVIAGRRLAWYFAHVAIEGVVLHVADSYHEAACQKVLGFVRSGDDGKRSRRDVVRKCRMSVKDIDDVIRSLSERELIAQEVTSPISDRGGRPSTFYVALKE